jgi:hypothetical protein
MGKPGFKFPNLSRPKRRNEPIDENRRQRCIDYYVATHTIQDLAGMLVDLEWREGCELAEE